MRVHRHFVLATAILFFVQGGLCSSACFAAGDAGPNESHASSNTPTATPPCHGTPTRSAGDDPDSRAPKAQCSHCEEPAISASALVQIDAPEPAITPRRIPLAIRSYIAPAYAIRTAPDPPPQDLLLTKNSFLI